MAGSPNVQPNASLIRFADSSNIPSHGLDPLEAGMFQTRYRQFGHGHRIAIGQGPCGTAFFHQLDHTVSRGGANRCHIDIFAQQPVHESLF
jgi:hypothetical protein